MQNSTRRDRRQISNDPDGGEWMDVDELPPLPRIASPGFWERNKQRFQGGAMSLTVIGLILAFFQDIIPYHLYFLEKESKSLQVVILANASLVQVADTISKDIRIEYKDEQIKNLSLVTVKLEHNGNVPIRPEDYARPIAFQFPEGSEVLEARQVQSEPVDLGISLSSITNTVTLSPVLLNPKDRVVIQFILANVPLENPYWSVSARIAGQTGQIPIVTAIEEPNQPQEGIYGLNRLGQVAFMLGILVILSLLASVVTRMFRGR